MIVVFDPTNIQILKQFTTRMNSSLLLLCCFRPYKYTNFKAIHNMLPRLPLPPTVVFDPTNIQILKQFTTADAFQVSSVKLFSTLQIYKF